MAITTDREPLVLHEQAVTERKTRPVMVWAVIGAIFLAIEAYAVIGWIVSGNATATPHGATPIPTWDKWVLDGWQAFGVPCLLVFLWHFLVKPWRKEGHITTDGLLCLVFGTIWWQDPMSNWSSVSFTYNSYMLNFGNWTHNIPGWPLPHSNQIAEPTLWVDPIYIYLVFGAAVVGSVLMRKIKARWPEMGTFGILSLTFLTFMVFDALLEPILMALGFWSYPSTVPWLTLWHGTRFQYPIYEAFFWGGVWTLWASVRYFRDDKGETLAERGIDQVRVSGKKKTGLRFLALAGICNFLFLFAYNVPIQFFVIHQANWPSSISNRSYLTDNLCGPGTTYICSGKYVPIPIGNGSAHVTPTGSLFLPAGSKLPATVPELTKRP